MSHQKTTPAKNLPKIPKQGSAKNPTAKNLLIIAYLILAAIIVGMLQDPYCM